MHGRWGGSWDLATFYKNYIARNPDRKGSISARGGGFWTVVMVAPGTPTPPPGMLDRRVICRIEAGVSGSEVGAHQPQGPIQGRRSRASDVVVADQLLETGNDLIIGNREARDVKTEHSRNDFSEVDKLQKKTHHQFM